MFESVLVTGHPLDETEIPVLGGHVEQLHHGDWTRFRQSRVNICHVKIE